MAGMENSKIGNVREDQEHHEGHRYSRGPTKFNWKRWKMKAIFITGQTAPIIEEQVSVVAPLFQPLILNLLIKYFNGRTNIQFSVATQKPKPPSP
jgi:hypothetical protein